MEPRLALTSPLLKFPFARFSMVLYCRGKRAACTASSSLGNQRSVRSIFSFMSEMPAGSGVLR
jgi:hypothetical protein